MLQFGNFHSSVYVAAAYLLKLQVADCLVRADLDEELPYRTTLCHILLRLRDTLCRKRILLEYDRFDRSTREKLH